METQSKAVGLLGVVSLALVSVTTPAQAEEAPAPTVAPRGVSADGPDTVFDGPTDLRTGQWSIAIGGGLASPTSELVPAIPELGELSYGAGGRLRLGWGLNRHLTLGVEGGFTYLTATGNCDGCRSKLIDAGASLSYHIAQAFAMDPWISYGVGYRHITVDLPSESKVFHGIDFARVALGADYFPTPAFGFGPYLATDVGMRDDENTVFYGVFHTGLRLSFEPTRAGTQLTPSVASR